MQHPSRSHQDNPPGTQFIASDDVLALLRVMAALGALRSDGRAWRQELLAGLMHALPASAAAAFILKQVALDTTPIIVSLFDVGFRLDAHRHCFLQEFNVAPFRDPLSRRALDRFIAGQSDTFTATRVSLVDDLTWHQDPHVQLHRHGAATDDCILSFFRGIDRGTAYALLAFRPSEPIGASRVSQTPLTPEKYFGPRESAMLNVMHASLGSLYRGEESTHRLNRSTELPPRLRQTLECLLAGATERQAALKMSLSVHTVHDYVKALYSHFGVSSRGELIAKWMQTGGQLPSPRKEP